MKAKAANTNRSALYETEDQQIKTRENFDAQHTEFQASTENGYKKFKLDITQYTPLSSKFTKI